MTAAPAATRETVPRFLHGLAVPYSDPTVVADPGVGVYVETFEAGSLRIPDLGTDVVPLLISHRPHVPIGRITRARDTAEGLEVEAKLGGSTGELEGIAEKFHIGVLAALSIGFIADSKADLWTRSEKTGLPKVTRRGATLAEISLCLWPAYRKAAVVLGLSGTSIGPSERFQAARLTQLVDRIDRKRLDERIDALGR